MKTMKHKLEWALMIAAVMLLLAFALMSISGQAAGFKGEPASPAGSCRNPHPVVFYETLGGRSMTVTYAPGCEPDFEWTGTANDTMLEGRFGDPRTGYMWWFVWPEEAAQPITYWQPSPSGDN